MHKDGVERFVIVFEGQSAASYTATVVPNVGDALGRPASPCRTSNGRPETAMETVDQPMYFVQFPPQQPSGGVTPSRNATKLRSSVPRFGGFELPGDIGNL